MFRAPFATRLANRASRISLSCGLRSKRRPHKLEDLDVCGRSAVAGPRVRRRPISTVWSQNQSLAGAPRECLLVPFPCAEAVSTVQSKISAVRSGTVPMVLLRAEYEAVRFPLQVIEDDVMPHLDERAPLRLAYESLLIRCDDTAANLLHDQAAATRAHALRERTAAIRVTIALAQRRTRQRLEAEGTARMERWRQYSEQRWGHAPSPYPAARNLPWIGPGADG